jgi:hypothetical protein
MKNPNPETMLTLALCEIRQRRAECIGTSVACDATRAVALAQQVRRLVESSCNVELTSRQDKRLESLKARADDVLRIYGLKLDNPWGLCFYAVPVGHDGRTQHTCTFLA